MLDKIIIKGAREHNLKNVDLELPKNKLIVFTGISGSGKSTLAFDTIFAEGQRRYIESLSSYARQFLGQMEKPNVDYIEGLSPAIAIDQKSASRNPRSTVGTITEIYDYLRLLFAKIGLAHCVNCGKTIKATNIEQIMEKVLELREGVPIKIYAPIVRGRKGEYLEMLNNFYRDGFSRARIDGKVYELSKTVNLARYKIHSIDLLVDELTLSSDNLVRLRESLEQALKIAQGLIIIEQKNQKLSFNQKQSCLDCDLSFPELEPRLFSFNSPYGACANCSGLGFEQQIDPSLVIPDFNKTIAEGGVLPFSYKSGNYYGTLLRAVTEELGVDTHHRLKDWTKGQIHYLLYGSGYPERLKLNLYAHGAGRTFYLNFNGIIPWLERRWKETESDMIRRDLEKYMSKSPCPSCHGDRLKKEATQVKIKEKNIVEVSNLTITKAEKFIDELKLTTREGLIAEKIIKEIKNRLGFLISVGLDYLTLDREASSLSGGEAQRIRLASQIGSALTGVLYVLDEPSIGLHARDQKKLIDILVKLRDLGNTVIVVEHDEQTIKSADWITDIGPGAGSHGGKIIFNGQIDKLLDCPKSITAKYLNGVEKIMTPEKRRKIKGNFLTIKGANEHNLKNLNLHIPLGVFNIVTGVSGSGKSTLVNDIIYKSLARKLHKSMEKPGKVAEISGSEHLEKVIIIDQSPIGRTPRSNPATYTGIFSTIRELFAKTRQARLNGYTPGRFSFNVAGGRCEECRGDGFLKIEMQFLPDVYIPCDTCGGKRYNKETLGVYYKEKNIAEVLAMTVDEALEFFANINQISDKLELLSDVGLGYIQLGQAATTLSGGEAQRIKLATELSRPGHGKSLYILDEPTTGLHFADVEKLLGVLNKLVDAGNTVLVIEHNLDVIKSADNIIDLGPEGGDEGGKIVAQGTPEEIAQSPNSYTGQFLKKVL